MKDPILFGNRDIFPFKEMALNETYWKPKENVLSIILLCRKSLYWVFRNYMSGMLRQIEGI